MTGIIEDLGIRVMGMTEVTGVGMTGIIKMTDIGMTGMVEVTGLRMTGIIKVRGLGVTAIIKVTGIGITELTEVPGITMTGVTEVTGVGVPSKEMIKQYKVMMEQKRINDRGELKCVYCCLGTNKLILSTLPVPIHADASYVIWEKGIKRSYQTFKL